MRQNFVDAQTRLVARPHHGRNQRLPVARELGETSLMLLVHPTLTAQNIEDTIRVVKEVVARATR
ncbi:MAG: hypothetical protein GX569_08105 [Candidatus Riflebacteria bacterium]|nr:hypothetical protein [Candidatus Riflebacteria bacterium]